MKITIYPEIHCDECNQIIHNHLDCPICNKYSESENYSELEKDEILVCECGAQFKLISGS